MYWTYHILGTELLSVVLGATAPLPALREEEEEEEEGSVSSR